MSVGVVEKESSRLWNEPWPADWWTRPWPFVEKYGDLVLRARDITWHAGLEWQIVRMRPDISPGRFDTLAEGMVRPHMETLILQSSNLSFEAMDVLATAWHGEFGRWAKAAVKLKPQDFTGGRHYG